MRRPYSIVAYERLQYAQLAAGALSVLNFIPDWRVHPRMMLVMLPPIIFMLGVSLFLIWLTAYKRQNWARWTGLVVLVLGVLSDVPFFSHATRSILILEDAVIQFLCVASEVFLFTPEANKWFADGRNDTRKELGAGRQTD